MAATIGIHVDVRSRPLSIGEAAERAGVAAHVLRHWEAVGLLAPRRDPAGRRSYRQRDLYRIAAIQRAKEAGLPLEVIRDLVEDERPAARRAALGQHRDRLAERIARDRAALALVERALQCDHESVSACPQFRAVLQKRVDPPSLDCSPDHGVSR